MLRSLGTLLVGLLTAVAFGTFASAQSPAVDWDFEAVGTGWRVSNAAFALATPAHAGTSAARLVAFGTEPMRIATLVPFELPGEGSTSTVSAWVLASPAEVGRATLQLEAFTDTFAALARREVAVLLGESFVPAEAALALPPGAAYIEVTLVAVPLREGARVLVDSVHLGAVVTPGETPTPTPSPTPTAATTSPTHTPTQVPSSTATASPTATRTATAMPAATSTRAPTSSPTPLATPVVFPVLTNGGFEDPRTLYGWSAQGGAPTLEARVDGRVAMLTSASASTKWLQQAVGVTPGARYRASAWLRTGAGGDAWLRVAWYASEDTSGGQISVVDSAFAPLPGGVVAIEAMQAPPDARSARVRLMLRPASVAPAVLEADHVGFEAIAPPPPPTATPPSATLATGDAVTAGGPAAPEASPTPPARPPTSPPTRPVDATAVFASASTMRAPDQGAPTLRLLRITELLPDPTEPGPDADFEWVELANLGPAAESLAGFTLLDNGGTVELPPMEVPPGAALVLAAPRAATGSAALVQTLARGISNGLGNAGDRVALRSPEGDVVDAVSWGSDRTYAIGLPELPAPSAGRSILRRFNDDGSFADAIESANPTPGEWLDSRALPSDHAPAHLATIARSTDRGWPLLLAIAGVALAFAGADRVRRVLQAR